MRDRHGGSDAVQEIRTDPVPITVTSVVPEGADYIVFEVTPADNKVK